MNEDDDVLLDSNEEAALHKDWWSKGRTPSGHEGLDTLLFGGFAVGVLTTIEGPREALALFTERTSAYISPPVDISQTSVGPTLASLAREQGISVVLPIEGDLPEIPKNIKFYASVRLCISNGVLKVVKDMTTPRQGHSIEV